MISRLVFLAVLGASIMLGACDKAAVDHKARGQQPHRVTLTTAEIQAVRTPLTASSLLQARQVSRISNEIAARITELRVRPGDRVTQGELLIRLDDSLIIAELDKARAKKQQAESEYQRLKKLRPKQLASEEEIVRARTALQVATAEEKWQRTRLAKTRLRAAFDGVVTERLAEPGDSLPVGNHLLTIIDPDSLYLKLQLAEQWLPWLQAGDPVSIRIAALDNSLFEGSIERIYPTIDPVTRKGTLEVVFSPQPFGVRAGQLATVSLHTRSVDRLVIPVSSLQHDSLGAFVYTVDSDNVAHKKRIRTGRQYGDLITVDSGLSAGQTIVGSGFIGLRDGKQVKPGDATKGSAETT